LVLMAAAAEAEPEPESDENVHEAGEKINVET
jgi:hypothetical protein